MQSKIISEEKLAVSVYTIYLLQDMLTYTYKVTKRKENEMLHFFNTKWKNTIQMIP